MCYDVHEFKPPLLSFQLFIFLSTSHARPHSVVTLLSLILTVFFFLPTKCNHSLIHSLLLTSVHLLSDSIAHLSYYLSAFLLLHLPSIYSDITFLLPIPLCISQCISLFTISLSQQCVCLCFGPAVSCLFLLYAHIHPAHICTSVCMPMTVWRSPRANPKHKGRLEAGNDRRKVEWTERQGGREEIGRMTSEKVRVEYKEREGETEKMRWGKTQFVELFLSPHTWF